MSDNIHVAIRVRPLIRREINQDAEIFWSVKNSQVIFQTCSPSTSYRFDRVFDSDDDNDVVYTDLCSPIVKSVMQGFNGTIFAYGQTSSGKTFTMLGNDDNAGIIPNTIHDIFNAIQNMPEREFLLRVSYMEIYNEMVSDLLSINENKNMKIQEDTDGIITVVGLQEMMIKTSAEVFRLMRKGERKRHIGETNMNEKSSRSHTIFRMIIESRMRDQDTDAAVNVSHLNLVDLAGSERAGQTGVTGERFKEGVHINKSLLMLAQVIRQLSDEEGQYVSYRDSKLTRILQNSLGGNARTVIICTVTPASLEQTHSTLKFAIRAKRIQNKPTANVVMTEQALLKRYANEIRKLSTKLETLQQQGSNGDVKEMLEKELQEKNKQNENLKQQIHELKEKFVVSQFAGGERVVSKKNRRETWGGGRFGGTGARRLGMMGMSVDSSTSLFNQLPVLQEEPTWNTSPNASEPSEKEFLLLANRKSSNDSPDWSPLRLSFPKTLSEVAVQTNENSENMRKIQKQLKTTLAQLSSVTLMNNRLTKEYDELKEFTSLEKQIVIIENQQYEEIKILKARNDELQNKYNELISKVSSTPEEVKAISDLKAVQSTDWTADQDSIKSLNEQLLSYQQQCKENCSQLDKIKQELADAEVSLGYERTQHKIRSGEKDQCISQLREEVNNLTKLIGSLVNPDKQGQHDRNIRQLLTNYNISVPNDWLASDRQAQINKDNEFVGNVKNTINSINQEREIKITAKMNTTKFSDKLNFKANDQAMQINAKFIEWDEHYTLLKEKDDVISKLSAQLVEYQQAIQEKVELQAKLITMEEHLNDEVKKEQMLDSTHTSENKKSAEKSMQTEEIFISVDGNIEQLKSNSNINEATDSHHTLKDSNSQLNEVNMVIVNLEAEMAQKQEFIFSLENNIQVLEQELKVERKKDEIRCVQKSIKDGFTSMESDKLCMCEQQVEIIRLKNDTIAELNCKLDKSEKLLAESAKQLNQQLSKYQMYHDSTDLQIHAKQQEISSLSSELVKYKQKYLKREKKIKVLNEQLNETFHLVTDFKTQLQKEEAILSFGCTKSESKYSVNSSLETSQQNKEMLVTDDEISSLQEKVFEFEVIIAEKNIEISNLELKLREITDAFSKTQQQLDDLREEIASQEEYSLGCFEESNTTLPIREITRLPETKLAIVSDEEKSEINCIEYKSHIEDLKKKDENIFTLGNELSQHKLALKEKDSNLVILKNQLDELTNTVSKLTKEFEEEKKYLLLQHERRVNSLQENLDMLIAEDNIRSEELKTLSQKYEEQFQSTKTSVLSEDNASELKMKDDAISSLHEDLSLCESNLYKKNQKLDLLIKECQKTSCIILELKEEFDKEELNMCVMFEHHAENLLKDINLLFESDNSIVLQIESICQNHGIKMAELRTHYNFCKTEINKVISNDLNISSCSQLSHSDLVFEKSSAVIFTMSKQLKEITNVVSKFMKHFEIQKEIFVLQYDKEVENLKQTIHSLTTENSSRLKENQELIEIYKVEIEKLKFPSEELKKKEIEILSLQEQTQQLNLTLNEKDDQITNLIMQKGKDSRANDEFSKKIEIEKENISLRFEKRIKHLQENVDSLIKEDSARLNEIESLTEKYNQMVQEVASMSEQLEIKDSEISLLRQQLSQFISIIDEEDSKTDCFAEEQKDTSNAIETLTKDLETEKQYLSLNYENRLSCLQKTVDSLNEELESRQEALQSLNQAHEEKVKELISVSILFDDVSKKLSVKDQEVLELRKELELNLKEKDILITNLQTSLEKSETSYANLKKEIERKKDEETLASDTSLESIDLITKQNSSIHQELDVIYKKFQPKFNELRSNSEKNSSYIHELKIKDEEISTLHQKLNQSKATITEKESCIDTLRKKISKNEVCISDLCMQINKCGYSLEKAKEQFNEEKESLISKYEDKMNSLKFDNDLLTKENDSINTEIKKISENINAKIAEIKTKHEKEMAATLENSKLIWEEEKATMIEHLKEDHQLKIREQEAKLLEKMQCKITDLQNEHLKKKKAFEVQITEAEQLTRKQEMKVNAYRTHAKEMANKLKQIKHELQDKTAEFNSTKLKLETLSSDTAHKSDQTNSFEELKSRFLLEAKHMKAEFRKKFDEKCKELESTKSHYDRILKEQELVIKEQILTCNKQKEEMESAMSNIQIERDEAFKRIKQLELLKSLEAKEQNSKLKMHEDEITKKITAIVSQLKTELCIKETQLNALKIQQDSSEKEIFKLKGELKKLDALQCSAIEEEKKVSTFKKMLSPNMEVPGQSETSNHPLHSAVHSNSSSNTKEHTEKNVEHAFELRLERQRVKKLQDERDLLLQKMSTLKKENRRLQEQNNVPKIEAAGPKCLSENKQEVVESIEVSGGSGVVNSVKLYWLQAEIYQKDKQLAKLKAENEKYKLYISSKRSQRNARLSDVKEQVEDNDHENEDPQINVPKRETTLAKSPSKLRKELEENISQRPPQAESRQPIDYRDFIKKPKVQQAEDCKQQ